MIKILHNASRSSHHFIRDNLSGIEMILWRIRTMVIMDNHRSDMTRIVLVQGTLFIWNEGELFIFN